MDTLAVQLMVPTTKPIADFHRLVTAHAGQTSKKLYAYLGTKLLYLRTFLRTISHYNHLDLLDKKDSAGRQTIDFIASQALPRKMIT